MRSWTGRGFRYQQQQHLAGLLPHGPKGTRPLGLQPDVTPATTRAGDPLVRLGKGENRRRQEGSGEVKGGKVEAGEEGT